jgi:predicted RNA binding protein YcfA (HicA-like mRNA interferase family)
MSAWPAVKSSRALAALLRIGWNIKRQTGSHKTLQRDGYPNFVFAFHDSDEIGPRMMARIAKHTGLKPEDL